MIVKFWGVRGSIPTPERRNSSYGGNTTCIEIRLDNNALIILDCGSGLRALGKSLLREFGARPLNGSVFLTHFHWDHVKGIPFFLPLYKKGNAMFFHTVLGDGRQLKAAAEGSQFELPLGREKHPFATAGSERRRQPRLPLSLSLIVERMSSEGPGTRAHAWSQYIPRRECTSSLPARSGPASAWS